MAYLAAIPYMEAAAEGGLTLFKAAAAGALVGGWRRARREGFLQGGKLQSKPKALTPMAFKRRYAGGSGRRVRQRLGRAPTVRTAWKRTRYYRVLGEKPGTRPSKKHLGTYSNTVLEDKRLANLRIITVPYQETEAMNRRQGRLANVTGVKLRMWFAIKNQTESTAKLDTPITVRWAVLNPKENSGDVTDVNTSNFFISADPGQDDATDFPSTGNSFRYMNRKINRRRFGVVQQGKFILSNDPASTNSRVDIGSRKLVNLWLPIRRQMKWGNNVDTHPNTNLHFVFWYTQMGDKDTAQKFSGDGALDVHGEHVTYFRDSPGFN
jgi:hypothetical protein